MFTTFLLGVVLAIGIILFGVYAVDDNKDDAGPVVNDDVAIQQYRHWKTQASSYAELEEINDWIDEARERSRR